jgi:mannose-6-phosphate isomerase-like protein (cupin superfamily)
MRKALMGLLVVAGALSTRVPVAHAGDKPAKSGAQLVPAADVKWGDVPGMAGVKMAALDGDPAKGPSHFFLKFVGGFSAPLHHHSANHFVTVVSGTLVLTVDGVEHKLPAGSFAAFSNKTKHLPRCEAGADCVLAMDVRGKWDVVPAEKTVAAK